ncbi:MAG: MerR family transcriptional regulator [Planctomycetota bacterium]
MRRNAPGSQVRLLRTAEVLRLAGITHQVLYRYVTLGLIEPAAIAARGQRYFRPEVVDLIRIIQDFNREGYSLRDLKDTFFQDKNVRRLLQLDE